eukprot:766226-Hanusia_phi.AAC.1
MEGEFELVEDQAAQLHARCKEPDADVASGCVGRLVPARPTDGGTSSEVRDDEGVARQEHGVGCNRTMASCPGQPDSRGDRGSAAERAQEKRAGGCSV